MIVWLEKRLVSLVTHNRELALYAKLHLPLTATSWLRLGGSVLLELLIWDQNLPEVICLSPVSPSSRSPTRPLSVRDRARCNLTVAEVSSAKERAADAR